MAVSTKPWSAPTLADFGGDVGRLCSACLIDLNPAGQPKVAGQCKLPYKEPGGAVNANALRAISGVLAGARGGVQAPADAKKAAARKLVGLMRGADMQPGDGLLRMAGM